MRINETSHSLPPETTIASAITSGVESSKSMRRPAPYDAGGDAPTIVIGGTGPLYLPPLLMIVFREKYPRWWYDWNLELVRFTNRVGTYLALMNDRYPSTDER